MEITDRKSELLQLLVEMWEEGALVVDKNNSFNRLATTIHQCFEIRKKNSPEGTVQLSSLKTELYKYVQKNNKQNKK